MRILIVDTYYPAFLIKVYERDPGRGACSYSEQWLALMAECFGTADFYSRNLRALGHESTEIVTNCAPLQRRWATEQKLLLKPNLKRTSVHGIPLITLSREWQTPIMLSQIEAFRPDVVHFQNPSAVDRSTLQKVRQMCGLMTCQIASPIEPGTAFDLFHLVLSSFPHFVQEFRDAGVPSEYFRLGFEPSLRERLDSETRSAVVFVGGFSASHAERIRFFESLAALHEFDWWGYGVENLAARSPLRNLYRGQAWGTDMYQKLHDARISLNHHIDVARDSANNMRLFEATGVGSMLLTDHKTNLSQMFEPEREVITFKSPAECAEKLRYYLGHESARADVARRGEMRTLRDHTYAVRMKEFVTLLEAVIS